VEVASEDDIERLFAQIITVVNDSSVQRSDTQNVHLVRNIVTSQAYVDLYYARNAP
jgi:hypothetical protein